MRDPLRPLKDQIGKLWGAVDRMPSVRLGTVAGTSPLTVNLDGDIDLDEDSPTYLAPIETSAVSVMSHTVGQRVICVEQHKQILVIQAGA